MRFRKGGNPSAALTLDADRPASRYYQTHGAPTYRISAQSGK